MIPAVFKSSKTKKRNQLAGQYDHIASHHVENLGLDCDSEIKPSDESSIIVINEGDILADNKVAQRKMYRRAATLRDNRTVMDKFIDQFWLVNVEREEKLLEKEFTVMQIDEKVHQMIHQLLLKAEDDHQKVYKVHLRESMVHHQELINAIKDEIKPGLFKQQTQKFTPIMLKAYFNRLQKENIDDGMQLIKNKLKMNFGVKLLNTFKTEQERRAEEDRKMTAMYEASIKLKEKGLRSIHLIDKKKNATLQTAVFPNDPEYIAYK